jgi:hypothetical protein
LAEADCRFFDATVTLQAIHETRHRNRAPALFRQIRAILMPGGLFLYCDHYLNLVTNPALYLERGEQSTAFGRSGFRKYRMHSRRRRHGAVSRAS